MLLFCFVFLLEKGVADIQTSNRVRVLVRCLIRMRFVPRRRRAQAQTSAVDPGTAAKDPGKPRRVSGAGGGADVRNTGGGAVGRGAACRRPARGERGAPGGGRAGPRGARGRISASGHGEVQPSHVRRGALYRV